MTETERRYTEAEVVAVAAHLTNPAVVTRSGRLLAANAPWFAALHHAPADVAGMSVGDLMPVEERERLLGHVRVATAERVMPQLRTLAMTKEGARVPVIATSSPFPAIEGEPYWLVSLVIDEQERKEMDLARELLGLSASLLSAATEQEVRERTLEAVGRAGFWARFLGDDDEPPSEATRLALAEPRPVFRGARSSQPDAVYIPIDDAETLLIGGAPLSAQQTYTFTLFSKLLRSALVDARAAETARRELSDVQGLLALATTTASTLELEALMALACDSIAEALDVSNCFILLHDEGARVLRASASSLRLRGAVSHIVVPIDDRKSISARAARERRVVVVGNTATDAEAKESRFVEAFAEKALVALPMLSRDRLEGIVIVDDTRGPREFSEAWLARAGAMVAQVGLSIANARLYESLRTSYAELAQTRAAMVQRERLAALGELAAIVAHEVRNPLGVIYNAESSLRRVVGSSKDGAVLLDIIHEECRRLNQIVGDLIDFARPRELSMQPEPLPRVVQEAMDIATSQPDAPPIRVLETVEGPLPLVPMDRRLIRQAIANIAINAIQAMPRGGTLGITVRFDAADHATMVEISDEGSGIPAEVLPRIFEPFFTTKAKGAGLGLAVVKRIVEDHGGRIIVSARTGGGTTFCIRLPVPVAPVGVEVAL